MGETPVNPAPVEQAKVELGKIKAPWTAEQVEALKKHQANPQVHPYTCTCGAVLIPTPEGWVCEKCPYRQDWAHDPISMLTGTDQCNCGAIERGLPYPACPHDMRGPTGPQGNPGTPPSGPAKASGPQGGVGFQGMQGHSVSVGQVWKDNDKRRSTVYLKDRYLEIIAVSGSHATVKNQKTGKKTRVAVRRFQPTHNGYRWVSGPW